MEIHCPTKKSGEEWILDEQKSETSCLWIKNTKYLLLEHFGIHHFRVTAKNDAAYITIAQGSMQVVYRTLDSNKIVEYDGLY